MNEDPLAVEQGASGIVGIHNPHLAESVVVVNGGDQAECGADRLVAGECEVAGLLEAKVRVARG